RVTAYQPPMVRASATGPTPCASGIGTYQFDGQATAIATNPLGGTSNVFAVAQTREPASLVFLGSPTSQEVVTAVPLGGPSVYDSGHTMFHRDAGMGIACASCHVEGQEDGRVWHFTPTGARRTQALDVGLANTAPFHWDGDMTP